MSYPPGPPDEDGPRQPPGPPGQPPGQPPYGGQGQPGYGQPGYPPPGYPQQPGYPGSSPSTNGKALASLITGIATLVLSWCCFLGILGPVAVFLGFKARSEIKSSGGAQSGDGLALAGIITGAVATLIGLAGLAFLIFAIATGTAEFSTDPTAPYGTDF